MATINGTAGNDTVNGDDVDFFGNGGDDTIHGLAGNDTIDGLGGSNQLFGDDGDDVFVISKFVGATSISHSSYDGGAGFDTLDLSRSGPSDLSTISQVDGGSFSLLTYINNGNGGKFTVDSIKNVEQIILGSYDNRVLLQDWTGDLKIDATHVNTGGDIYTGKGNDTIIGGSGTDQVFYEGGNDQYSIAGGYFNIVIVDHISGNADHSVVTAGNADFTDQFAIFATALASGPANVDLAAGTATIGSTSFALSGFDRVSVEGSGFVSTVSGDDNANRVEGGDYNKLGSFIFNGRGGNDTIFGGISGDQIDGGDGNDSLDGNGANDLVGGGAGDDVITGGTGNNILDGGDGNDYISGGGYDPGHIAPVLQAVVSGSDTITGGDGNDHIWGNVVSGAGGADGADSIDAGNGQDYVNGNAGADTIHGGAGPDRLYGGADNDQVHGDSGNDHINGNKGSDTLDGGDGDDQLYGGQDGDLMFGGNGNDTLSGDIGADTLHGGLGQDVLTGGADVDVFAFSPFGPLDQSEASFATSGSNAGLTDVITDFAAGTDKLALGFTPAAILSGISSTFAGAAALAQQLADNHAGDHEVATIRVGSDTYLFFQASGGDDMDSTVKMIGLAVPLSASDFA